MAGKTKRAALPLTQDHETMLRRLAGSRTAPVREVERARVLLGYAEGIPITDLARRIGISRPAIYACIDKALAAGVPMGLRDAYHRPHEPEISDDLERRDPDFDRMPDAHQPFGRSRPRMAAPYQRR